MKTSLNDEEKNRILNGIAAAEKLQVYSVTSSAVTFCNARGIKPVIYWAFLNIDYENSDERYDAESDCIDVRFCIDNPIESDFPKLKEVIIQLRIQQNIVIPNAISQYLKYIETLKKNQLSSLLSDI